MRIAGTIPCSLVNGPGIRYVIFTQGCPHKCFGCQNPETWDPDGGVDVRIGSLVTDITINQTHIDGVTISGGEPFSQARSCCRLIEEIKKIRPELNFWLYTGYRWNDIKDHPLTKLVNVVVTGRFQQANKVEGKLYGSSNQMVIDTKTGRALSGY